MPSLLSSTWSSLALASRAICRAAEHSGEQHNLGLYKCGAGATSRTKSGKWLTWLQAATLVIRFCPGQAAVPFTKCVSAITGHAVSQTLNCSYSTVKATLVLSLQQCHTKTVFHCTTQQHVRLPKATSVVTAWFMACCTVESRISVHVISHHPQRRNASTAAMVSGRLPPAAHSKPCRGCHALLDPCHGCPLGCCCPWLHNPSITASAPPDRPQNSRMAPSSSGPKSCW